MDLFVRETEFKTLVERVRVLEEDGIRMTAEAAAKIIQLEDKSEDLLKQAMLTLKPMSVLNVEIGKPFLALYSGIIYTTTQLQTASGLICVTPVNGGLFPIYPTHWMEFPNTEGIV